MLNRLKTNFSPGIDLDTSPAARIASANTSPLAPRNNVRSRSKNAAPLVCLAATCSTTFVAVPDFVVVRAVPDFFAVPDFVVVRAVPDFFAVPDFVVVRAVPDFFAVPDFVVVRAVPDFFAVPDFVVVRAVPDFFAVPDFAVLVTGVGLACLVALADLALVST